MPIQITPVQEERLQHLASQYGKSADAVLQEELDRFLNHEEALILAVKRANEDVAAGRVLAHKDVVARIDALLAHR